MLLYFSYFFGMAMFLSILSIYLSGSGKSDGEVSLIVSASGLFSMALQPCFGFLYDRVQKERTISMLLLENRSYLLFAFISFLFSGCASANSTYLTLLHIDFSLLIIQFTTYSFLPYAVPVCLILFLCRSTATMLYIMVTIKVVLNLVDRRCSTTALAVVSTMKSLGGVIVTMIAGAVSNACGRPAVFTLLLGIAAVGFILSALLKIPGNEQQLF